MRKPLLLLSLLLHLASIYGQTEISIYPDSIEYLAEDRLSLGVYYVPKTVEARNDFLTGGIQYNSIRTNIIEGALNNATGLDQCLAYLDAARDELQALSARSTKVIFVIEKMPVWLSSSNDGSAAATPGWFVLNTRPPASYDDWNRAITGIASKIVGEYGISNAYFEIWNEPDIGSWSGSKSEYFELFRNTYASIKSVDPSISVGGPATNHWGNNIGHQPAYGYLDTEAGDLSLLGELIDSTLSWETPLDFLSWHSFTMNHYDAGNAVAYISQKFAAVNRATPALMVSEWNTPMVVRDSPLQKAFFIKNKIELASLPIKSSVIAAWQDFDFSENEFHNSFGLLTYGGIHKPAYKAMQLFDKLGDGLLKQSGETSVDLISTLQDDTLSLLVTNYAPPPFVEAFNKLLFVEKVSIDQLDSLGYINVQTNDLSCLDSIFQGLKFVDNEGFVNNAINNVVPIYGHFDSLQVTDRDFFIDFVGLSNTYTGTSYTINDVQNNSQYEYEQLIGEGLSQAEAVRQITVDQKIVSSSTVLENGTLSFSMQPNSVALYQFRVEETTTVSSQRPPIKIFISPNPAGSSVRIACEKPLGTLEIFDSQGLLHRTVNIGNQRNYTVDLSSFRPGVYLFKFSDFKAVYRIVKS